MNNVRSNMSFVCCKSLWLYGEKCASVLKSRMRIFMNLEPPVARGWTKFVQNTRQSQTQPKYSVRLTRKIKEHIICQLLEKTKLCLSHFKFMVVDSGAVESEGFSTRGVGVAENFNDSNSGLTFCGSIVAVCATNVRKHYTWQFKWLHISAKANRGYSERLQRTELHTYSWLNAFAQGLRPTNTCCFWLICLQRGTTESN